MNIGLVVNARGKMCLVHDEPFDATPLWVGYHIDRRMLEVVFDNGATFPIEWESTDEMDVFLRPIAKILIIRMEDRRPVEGYDTSLLKMRCGRVIHHRVAVFSVEGFRGDERDGFLRVLARGDEGDAPPVGLVYAPLRQELILASPEGHGRTLSMSSPIFHGALLRNGAAFMEFAAAEDRRPGVWIPIMVNLDAPDRDRLPMGATAGAVAAPGPRLIARCIGWDARAGVATLTSDGGGGEETTPTTLFLDQTELARSGRAAIVPGETLACTPCDTGLGAIAALEPEFADGRFTPPPRREASPDQVWTWQALLHVPEPPVLDRFCDHLARSGLTFPEGRTVADVRIGDLPFYDDGVIVSISDADPSRHWTYFWSPRRLAVIPAGADRTNLERANALFDLNLVGENGRAYLRFVINCCDPSRLAPLVLAQHPDHLPWSADASDEDRQSVGQYLTPLGLEDGDETFARLRATVLFRTCLFSVRLLLARRPGRFAAVRGGPLRDYAAGAIEIAEPRLLVRGAPVLDTGQSEA